MFVCKQLSAMSADTFFRLAQVRTAVFVVEQACAYQEIDAIDQRAYHLWAADEQEMIISYARIFLKDEVVHFGRVLVAPAYRGQGEGHRLLQAILHQIQTLYPMREIRIEAQEHLAGYYGQYGFESISAPYEEDGILHIRMKKESFAN